MNRWIIFALVVTLGIAALVWSERHPEDVRVTPASLLYFIADSEWELSRLPMAVTRLSDAEEIEIGNRLAAMNHLDRPNVNLPPEEKQQIQAVRRYVSHVGTRVAAHAHRKLPYRFHYIPDMNFVNAFALPGGHVYIGAGLLSLMDSEDELAAVLGHEIEHIDHYHCAERVQVEARLRRLPLGELALIPVAIFEAGYNKDQELQADAEGAQLAVWAGYSPLGAERMFETFDRLYQEYVRRAESPQEELSQVAIETIEGYFRSHPRPSERIDQIRKLIAAKNWGSLTHERDLEVAYIFWTERTRRAFDAGHYQEAAGWAEQSLRVNSNQPGALRVLGRAQFAQANFDAAAAAFSKALDLGPVDDMLVAGYVDALAARHTPAEALREFTAWADSHPDLNGGLDVRMGLAQLTLLARGPEAADIILFPAVAPNARSLPPQLRGRYGWWFYSLGQSDSAAEWLQSAVQELPGDSLLQTRLGWVLIEQHNLESAIERFNTAGRGRVQGYYLKSDAAGQVYTESRVGLAVAQWQAQQFDPALGEFAGATVSQPEWLNPKWVAALYSPEVAKTIEALKAEQKKRRSIHVARNGD